MRLTLGLTVATCLAAGALLGACDSSGATAPDAAPTPDGAEDVAAPTPADVADDEGGPGDEDADDDDPIAPPCPAGSARGEAGLCWAEEVGDLAACGHPAAPPEPAVHVVEGADPGGADGSLAAPFATLEAALAAPGVATVLIHPGAYVGGVDVPAGVQVHGTCPAEVAVSGDPAGVGFRLDQVSGAGVHGLTIAGVAIGVQVLGSLDVTLTRLVIDEVQRGVDVQGATVVLTASRVEDVTATPAVVLSLTPGYGVSAVGQSVLVTEQLTVERTGRTALTVSQTELTIRGGVLREGAGSNLHVETGSRAAVVDTTIESALATGDGAAGVALLSAAEVTLRGCTLGGTDGPQLLAEASGPVLVEDCVLTGGREGVRLQLLELPATLRGCTISGAAGGGVVALEAAVTIGPGNLIEAVSTDPAGGFGDAIHLVGCDPVLVTGNTIDGPARLGVLLSGGTRGVVEDNEVLGAAIWAQVASEVTVRDNTVAEAVGRAIVALGSSLDVSGNTIQDVLADPAGGADGIVIAQRSAARVTDNLLPIPGGFIPNPLRAAILIDDPAPSTGQLLDLPDGLAVLVTGNTVGQATWGVVIQGGGDDAALVDVGDNDLAGAGQTTATDLGLQAPAGPLGASEAKLPIPGGFLEL